jgi:hypothetical protein
MVTKGGNVVLSIRERNILKNRKDPDLVANNTYMDHNVRIYFI